MFTSISARRWWRAGGALAMTGLLMAASAQAAPIQFGGGTYTQNFDTLATSGNNNPWSNGSTLQGWYLFTMANAEVTTYRAGSGSANNGAFYSFGIGTDADRALGGIGSGSVSGYIALALTNTSGRTINALDLAFNGEQWRNGGNTSAQTMVLEYGLGDSFTTVTQWTAVPALHWESPVTGPSAAAVDGNSAGRVPVSGALSNLNWGSQQTLWLRWIERNDTGNDHGLAIDDFSLAAAAAPSGSTFSIAALDADKAEGNAGSTPLTFTVTRSGDTAAAAAVAYAVTGSGTVAANGADFEGGTLPSGTLSFAAGETNKTLTIAVAGDTTAEPDEGFTVTLSSPTPGTLGTATARGIIRNDDTSTGFTKISSVQGSGNATPLPTNQRVTVQGMVTACVPNLSGFVLQATRPDEMDDDPATSEGLFVFYGANMPAFMSGGACPLGTTYQVNGVPGEYNGQTQLGSPNTYTVVYQGSASNLPAPVTIQLPVPDPTVWERYEGMRVKVVAASGRLVVTDNYNLGRYGGLTLAGGGLQTQYTELNAPDTQGNLAWLNAARLNQIQLDDGSSRQNPGLLPGRNGQPLSASNTLRAGDSTDAVIGYLDQFDDGKGTLALHENSYRIQPTAPPMFSGDARPVAHDIPAAIRDAGIKVASVNVLNYFTTLGTANFNTPLGNAMGGRGASNAAEFRRQEDKLVAKLLGLDADVMGLMEIQNNGFATPTGTTSNGKSAIQSLTDALNARAGADVYAFVSGPFKSGSTTVAAAGNDAITGGILYKRNRLTPVGPAAVPDRANLAQYDAFWGPPAQNGNRVPIAQTFQANRVDGSPDRGGEKFTVVVNHFKSKGSATVEQGMDQDDGQGNAYLAREKAAAQLLAWMRTHPTGDADPDPDVLLLGDFNAYSQEKAIKDLVAGGFQKVSSGYSYSFDGLWGSLDHIFASNALQASGQIAGVTKWHINAEEPAVLDYNTEYKSADQVSSYYAADAYRASDHNPLLIGLNLGAARAAPATEFSLPLAGVAGTLSATSCRLAATPTLASAPAAAPAGWQLPYPLLSFQAQDCGQQGSLTMTLTYPQALPAGAQLWKWGPTAANPADHWYTLPARIDGNTVTFTLTDGADGDADRTANGVIVDPVTVGLPLAAPGPGGPGTVAAVPTLHEWSMVLLALLMLGSAAHPQRRRR